MSKILKYYLLYFTLLLGSVLGLILIIERYPCLWPAFSHFEVFWKVYLDHFIASFLIPLWLFIILSGINILFDKQSNIKNQKIFMFYGLIAAMALAIIWDFIIPLYYFLKIVIQNSYGFFDFIGAVKLFYWYPRYEFVQFLFDWAGIFAAILFIKSFREDLK